MSDSLPERFAALAPTDDRSDWADVRRRAAGRRMRVPIILAAAVAALFVAAPAVGLVALLTPDSDRTVIGTILIVLWPDAGNPTATLSGDVLDGRVRTMVLALKGRPQRPQRVTSARTFLFTLSTKDLDRCGALHGLDARGRRIGTLGVPAIPSAPPKVARPQFQPAPVPALPPGPC